MAATLIGKKASERSGEDRDDFSGEVREVYLVQTDDKRDGPITVVGAVGIPALYSPYVTSNEQHFGLRCKGRRITQDSENPYFWEVEAVFASMTRDEEEESDDPTQRPPQVSFYGENTETPVVGEHQDVANADDTHFKGPIRNSAGMIFDPPPMMRQSRPVLEIEVSRTTVNPEQIFSYANAVNSDFFMGAEPRTLLMDPPYVSLEFENGVRHWKHRFRMTYNDKTWDLQLVDHGPKYRVAAGSTVLMTFTDADGHPRLGYLADDGTALPEDDDPNYLRFKVYKELPFGALGIEREL